MGSRIKNYDVYEIISKNIRRYRKERGMTQEELAIEANYSPQFIRRIEAPNIKKSFSLDTLYCIAKALKKDLGEMFDETTIDEPCEDDELNKV